MLKKGSILFLTLISVFFAFSVFAQTQSQDVALILTPEYPKANESVTATLSSYSTDLNKAKISWVLNGQLSNENIGQKKFSFRTGDTGSQTTLEVQIQTSDGSFVNKRIVISPADVDLLWEAKDAYVPPFYKGKTLVPIEGTVKVVAVTDLNGNEKYSYNWQQDDSNKPDSSGYAKNFYSFKNSYLETSNKISASVSDLFGNNIGTGDVIIKPNTPKILFYEKDPLLGTKWEKSLEDGYTITSNGQTIVAEPYFFSPKNLYSSNAKIGWLLGGSEINTPNVKNELSIRPQNGQSGSSTIQFSVNNIKTLFLSMTKTLNVNF